MVLLRHLLGDALRRLRLRQGRTLREVSAAARVSLGYLSEVERGQKEASSELLSAICTALGIPLSQVLREVSDNFALVELQSEPVFADVIAPSIDVEVDVATAGHAAGHAAGHEAERDKPLAVGARMQLSSAQLGAAQRVSLPAGSLPAGSLGVGEPVFEQVTRTAREITSMVPV